MDNDSNRFTTSNPDEYNKYSIIFAELMNIF